MWGYLGVFLFGYWTSQLREKFPKIQQIYRAIHEFVPSPVESARRTLVTIFQVKFGHLFESSSSKPIYHTHDLFDVEYRHRGKKYMIRIHDRVQGHCFINAYDETGKDISEKFLSYYGPNHDFHGHSYTPRDLGYNSITIIDEELNSIRFEADQPLRLG